MTVTVREDEDEAGGFAFVDLTTTVLDGPVRVSFRRADAERRYLGLDEWQRQPTWHEPDRVESHSNKTVLRFGPSVVDMIDELVPIEITVEGHDTFAPINWPAITRSPKRLAGAPILRPSAVPTIAEAITRPAAIDQLEAKGLFTADMRSLEASSAANDTRPAPKAHIDTHIEPPRGSASTLPQAGRSNVEAPPAHSKEEDAIAETVAVPLFKPKLSLVAKPAQGPTLPSISASERPRETKSPDKSATSKHTQANRNLLVGMLVFAALIGACFIIFMMLIWSKSLFNGVSPADDDAGQQIVVDKQPMQTGPSKAPSLLSISPDAITFTGLANDAFLPNISTIRLRAKKVGAKWSIAFPTTWLDISPLNGTIATPDGIEVTVRVKDDFVRKAPNSYLDQITFTDDNSSLVQIPLRIDLMDHQTACDYYMAAPDDGDRASNTPYREDIKSLSDGHLKQAMWACGNVARVTSARRFQTQAGRAFLESSLREKGRGQRSLAADREMRAAAYLKRAADLGSIKAKGYLSAIK